MEELDLKDMFNYFKTKKLYIILIVILGLVIGGVYSFIIQESKYKSYTTILLTKESDTSTITSNDIALNRNLVDTYREIIKSKKVLNKVINNLNLNYSFSNLNNRVTVESINETELIKISVVDLDAELAMQIANETAFVFNSEIVKLYNIQNLGIVDEAEISTVPYNVNIPRQMIISFVIGLFVGLGFVFIMYYFDTTIKSVQQVEEKLGLPIIGAIPEMGGRKHE